MERERVRVTRSVQRAERDFWNWFNMINQSGNPISVKCCCFRPRENGNRADPTNSFLGVGGRGGVCGGGVVGVVEARWLTQSL